MLVLARKQGEKIRIGKDITITVLSTGVSRIRLGIEAPIELPVHREEVYEEIQREGRRG